MHQTMSIEVHPKKYRHCHVAAVCCALLLLLNGALPASAALLKGSPETGRLESKLSLLPSASSSSGELGKSDGSNSDTRTSAEKKTDSDVFLPPKLDDDKSAENPNDAEISDSSKLAETPDTKTGSDGAAGGNSLEGSDTKDVLASSDAKASVDASDSSSNEASSNIDENIEAGSSDLYNVAVRSFNAGAVWRGFLVFVGCSVLVVLYFGVRTACRRRRRGQRRYRKVDRTSDSDVFPLTEADDDDEEIFSADVQR